MASKFAIVTGASSGIGLELAKLAAQHGYDLLVAADTPFVDASAGLGQYGVAVETLETDLAGFEGVDRLLDAAGGREIDLLCANAGQGRGGAFLDQTPDEWRHIVDTNITGTVYLLQKVLRKMTARNAGKVLVTGSIADVVPGAFNATYNATKAFLDNFVAALRNEIKNIEGVTITTLMPGPTDTAFFERAGMLDTEVGRNPHKADPAKVAKDGFEAAMAGEDSIVSGWTNKIEHAGARVMPESVLAERHRKMAEPDGNS